MNSSTIHKCVAEAIGTFWLRGLLNVELFFHSLKGHRRLKCGLTNGSSETSGSPGHLGPDLKGVSSGLT
jgi:hypothetical protein